MLHIIFKHLSQMVLKKFYFYVFLWFEPSTPWCGAISEPGTFV